MAWLYSLMIPIAWLMSLMLGRDDRDHDHRQHRAQHPGRGRGRRPDARVAGRRTSTFRDTGYYTVEGRGGAGYKATTTPAWPTRRHFQASAPTSRQQLGTARNTPSNGIPVAEKAGVTMGCHPKDPPVKAMRGIERILTNTDQIEQYLDVADSAAHGFTFLPGHCHEMGVDVLDAIRFIGGRDASTTSDAPSRTVPKFVETFIDDGDVDMLEAMRAYHEVDYQGSLVSDYTPRIVGDFAGGRRLHVLARLHSRVGAGCERSAAPKPQP
ncbi:MAG: mannonate dehydratase [Bryobacterales bacterium]